MRRLLVSVASLAALVLSAAAPASAEVFVAYGTGVTVCQIRVHHEDNFGFTQRAFGVTDCNEPVEQTGHAVMNGMNAPACGGVIKHCYSGVPEEGGVTYRWEDGVWTGPLRYHVDLQAPSGQGWIGAPTTCSGVGTDNLHCVFEMPVGVPTAGWV